MHKILFENKIDPHTLIQLISSHTIHGFYYTIISQNTFTKLAEVDLSVNVCDMREQGLGYVWYSYNNLIYIVTDDELKDNELIYLKEEDLPILIRNKKIKRLKEIIN